jgi:ribosomal protein S18 acetylase RimI-like enzyme
LRTRAFRPIRAAPAIGGETLSCASIETRRLRPADADAFRGLRMEGLRAHPSAFRIAPEDEIALPYEAALRRFEEAYIVGGFLEGTLSGIAGYSRLTGAKLDHKGLVWGMYVRAAAQGIGLADALMERIVAYAAREVRQLVLTVAADNARAICFYRRWGFETYGVEPQSIRLGAETYGDEALMAKRLD